jgi:hypothetical protein
MITSVKTGVTGFRTYVTALHDYTLEQRAAMTLEGEMMPNRGRFRWIRNRWHSPARRDTLAFALVFLAGVSLMADEPGVTVRQTLVPRGGHGLVVWAPLDCLHSSPPRTSWVPWRADKARRRGQSAGSGSPRR